jgi:MFS family permease
VVTRHETLERDAVYCLCPGCGLGLDEVSLKDPVDNCIADRMCDGNSYFSPYFYANDFALSQGIPQHIATYATAILNAGSFTGRALSGPMAERFGVIEVFIASGSAGGICVLALWSSRDVGTAGSIIGLYLYGLFGGK